MAIDLKDNTVPDEGLADDLKGDVTPAPKADDPKPEDQAEPVPYHKDPNVQLYIERQVAKRVGEGNQAWEDRIARLEGSLKQKSEPETQKIGDWEPAGDAEAKAARAIISQAKQEMLEEQAQQAQAQKQQQEQNDRAFTDWLDELKTTSVLTEADSQDFAQMIVKYKLDDKQAAIELWNTLKAEIQQARDEGATEGEIKGIKKAQEAKIGSARKGNEPGQTGRSFKQRRAEEPNFSSILDRELSRMGK